MDGGGAGAPASGSRATHAWDSQTARQGSDVLDGGGGQGTQSTGGDG